MPVDCHILGHRTCQSVKEQIGFIALSPMLDESPGPTPHVEIPD